MSKFDKEFIADLACFMEGYVKEVQGHLIAEAENIASDPLLRKLLHEHRVHSEKQKDLFLMDLDMCLNHGFEQPTASCTAHPDSYHDVLDDLLVKDWWHEKCEEKRKEEAA